jgi:flagellin-like hook-associated protein FlgL
MTTDPLVDKNALKKNIKTYAASMKHVIMTSRFNEETILENKRYRNNNPKIGCIYCAPQTISKKVPIDAILFILEMNNDKNRIEGIGMVRNHPQVNRYNVYDNGNYNRYNYVGKHRIDRSEMTEEENKIMTVFDILCFTGNKHMKRGQGLKAFPVEFLYKCSKTLDLVMFITNMFKSRIN